MLDTDTSIPAPVARVGLEEALAAAAGEGEPATLAAARRTARERFAAVGFPTTRDEPWRFTNPAPTTDVGWRTADRVALDTEQRNAIESLRFAGCTNLVVVDGRFEPSLSDDPTALEGTAIEPLAAALDGERGGEIAERLVACAPPDSPHTHAFSWLNTALFADGLVVRVAAGALTPRPLHLIQVAVAGAEQEPVAVFPRTLVLAEPGSESTVLESYATVGDGPALSCPVTGLWGGENAVLRHYRVGRESRAAHHYAHQQAWVERNARVASRTLSYGGGRVRIDVHAVLEGEGCDCTLDGLYVLAGRQHFDTHMRVEHAAPHCNSHELYQGILDESARAVFDGLIYVHPEGQKTDAKQTNRNLLLSERSLVHSNPRLEIFADDVRCTHGSTIGQLDPDALFYLRQRGLDPEAARSVLVYAFASALLEGVRVEPLRDLIEAVLVRRLAGGGVMRELVEEGRRER